MRILARKADAEKYEKLGRLHRHALLLLRSDRRNDVVHQAEVLYRLLEKIDKFRPL